MRNSTAEAAILLECTVYCTHPFLDELRLGVRLEDRLPRRAVLVPRQLLPRGASDFCPRRHEVCGGRRSQLFDIITSCTQICIVYSPVRPRTTQFTLKSKPTKNKIKKTALVNQTRGNGQKKGTITSSVPGWGGGDQSLPTPLLLEQQNTHK